MREVNKQQSKVYTQNKKKVRCVRGQIQTSLFTNPALFWTGSFPTSGLIDCSWEVPNTYHTQITTSYFMPQTHCSSHCIVGSICGEIMNGTRLWGKFVAVSFARASHTNQQVPTQFICFVINNYSLATNSTINLPISQGYKRADTKDSRKWEGWNAKWFTNNKYICIYILFLLFVCFWFILFFCFLLSKGNIKSLTQTGRDAM